ncbi:MAG TPA: universal stress protein [Hanamia sp.]|nr:universal stress protein [Hanamia sp.]
MKTLLVPVDFTTASENAINFTAEWSRKYLYERIILLRSFYTSMYEGAIMSGEFANVDQDYLNRNRMQEKEQLDELCKRLAKKTGPDIKVQTAVTELPLIRGIIEVIKKEDITMVLLGSDQANSNNESLISGNVINIAKISPVRVLIVPENYQYKEIKKCLVPCNFNAVESLNKVNTLRTSPQWRDVQLMVLNVDAKQKHLAPDEKFKAAEKSLHEYLKNFHHSIYYVQDKNVISGILNFTKTNEVELLIALPGKYSFLYNLTHTNISEGLYRNTKIPVMILK